MSGASDGDLRARVLRASVELLEQEGVAGLSMREVARRAGVSHQAPYHHFADRSAILAAIAVEGFSMLQERFVTAASRPAKSALHRFEHLGVAYVEFALDRPAHFRVMFRPELVEPQKHPEAQAAGDGAFGALQAMVAACVAEGLTVEEPPEAIAAMAWSVAHGLSCLILDGPFAHTLAEQARDRDKLVRSVMKLFRKVLEPHVRPSRRR